ncbi:Hypothetical protein, putative [Bodo saltans]|uniref:Uncharacterized protein n=1 Tax=Bodo saltans TaxID=75058 RepID=A0A0S4J560_BODSA|nr:Hypothetical protein, putative [Bodo saltans]|eukprot:CUG84277.1 Hypothetical protein, putative [Bodo saltans]
MPVDAIDLFSTSGILHSKIPHYFTENDPHLRSFYRRKNNEGSRPQSSAEINGDDAHAISLAAGRAFQQGRPVSVLELARVRRSQHDRDILASNARLRRQLWNERDANLSPSQEKKEKASTADDAPTTKLDHSNNRNNDDDPLAASHKSYLHWQRHQQPQLEHRSTSNSPQRTGAPSQRRESSRATEENTPHDNATPAATRTAATKSSLDGSPERRKMSRDARRNKFSPLTRLPPTYHPKGHDPKGLSSIPTEHHNKLRVLEQLFETFELGQEIEAHRAEEEHHRIAVKNMAAKRALTVEAAQLRLQFANKMKRKAQREAFPALRRESSLHASTMSKHL